MPLLDTVIVGGGIAGLACARQLHEAGRSFLLLTDRLGGRMYAGSGPSRNFGATYITSDYQHVGRFVRKAVRIRKRDVYFHDGDRYRTLFHPRTLRQARALSRLYALLIPFRSRLNALRAQAPFVCQRDLLSADPLLSRYVAEPAEDFVRRHRLTEVHDIFTHPMLHSTVFVPAERTNAFYLLACLMPILVPTYLADFQETLERLTAGFGASIRRDTVRAVEATAGGCYRVHSDTDEWLARNVVLATPCHNTRRIFPEADEATRQGVQEIPMSTLHVAGRRQARFPPGKTVFLRPGAAATILFPLGDCDLLFCRTAEPDLSAYYEHYQVVGRVNWKTAIVLSGPTWRCLSPRPNLYTIGDYNVCGLEDSFLTGLFAANRILRTSPVQTRPYRSRPGLTGSPVRYV